MDQVFQLVGALAILTAFVMAQARRLATDATLYLALNFAGSVVLTFVAAASRDIGFFLLEVVWALVSLDGLRRKAQRA